METPSAIHDPIALRRTGLVDRIFRFFYEDRAWTAGQIIREIRKRLLSPAEHARADAMPEAAQAEQVAQLLRASRHLLILDNTESITAARAAIPHALDPAGQQDLKTLLGRLRGGRTLVLLGSRQAETWLSPASPGTATYPLPGLDPQAASVLVDRILTRHGATRHLTDTRERDALGELVTLLGGYPLPLTVVLPVLASTPPSAVLAELQAGGQAADPAGLIRKAVEYSHGKLDPALQASLQLLAPFTAVIPSGPILRSYQDLLVQDEAVRALGPVDLAAALDQAIAVGLAAPHDVMSYLIQVQPVLPWFLRSRLHGQATLQAATAQAHYQHYAQLAGQLHAMLTSSGDPQQRTAGQAAARAEYANLTTALHHAQRTRRPISSLIVCLNTYLDQAQQHGTRRQLLDTAIANYPQPATREQQLQLAQLHDLAGHTALTQHRLDDAAAHYQVDVQLQQAAGERRRQGVPYHQLGMVAQEQRRFADAEASYRQALDIFLEFGDRYETADVYHQLGRVAQDQRRFAEAEASYRQALDIYLEFGDRHSAASAYHQLGRVAQQQRRFAEAEASYRQALDIYRETDPRAASRAATMLGITLAMLGQHHEAIRILLQAAVIWHQQTGNWDSLDLAWLHRESTQTSPGKLETMIRTDVPPDLADHLSAAIQQAQDPADIKPDGDSHA